MKNVIITERTVPLDEEHTWFMCQAEADFHAGSCRLTSGSQEIPCGTTPENEHRLQVFNVVYRDIYRLLKYRQKKLVDK